MGQWAKKILKHHLMKKIDFERYRKGLRRGRKTKILNSIAFSPIPFQKSKLMISCFRCCSEHLAIF